MFGVSKRAAQISRTLETNKYRRTNDIILWQLVTTDRSNLINTNPIQYIISILCVNSPPSYYGKSHGLNLRK